MITEARVGTEARREQTRTYDVHIRDRQGNITVERIEAADAVDAQGNVCPDDDLLCRNPYVVLDKVRYYERQIIRVVSPE